MIDIDKMPQHIQSKEELAEIVPLLKGNFLTKNLNDEEITRLAQAMTKIVFKEGELIIKYGDIGCSYFVLAKGNVKVTVYNKGTDVKDVDKDSSILIVKYLGSGVGFGELALLYNDKRSASIQALETCETYALDGNLFKGMIVKSSIQKRTTKASSLNQVKLFGKCTTIPIISFYFNFILINIFAQTIWTIIKN